MDTHSLRKSLFAMALVGVLSPLALVDCASSSSGSGNPDGGACPVSAPTPGTFCSAAEGTMCGNYGGVAETPGCACCNGGPTSYSCTQGTWREVAYATGGGVPNNFEACPAIMPAQGTACSTAAPCGGGQRQSCTYDCDTGHGRAGSATCVNGSWNIMLLGLACPVEAGVDANTSDASDAAPE